MSSEIIVNNNNNKDKINSGFQIPFPPNGLNKKKYSTLPSNVAIPVGLAQVFIGGSMVIVGSLALRYRSYLFYYGTGLWAGTIAGITGALVVMATKQGLPKPRWLCGGRKWQIHVVIGATMLALTASILLSIFSTSGLMQDTMHSVGVELGTPTFDEERFEKRKASGVAINAVLLLLAMLEILLSFCSLGIALRVLCRNGVTSSLFSSDSDGSEVTMHDILGSGPEYEARKDRLLRWIGHQRRNFFSTPQHQNHPPPPPSVNSRRNTPHLVAIQPRPQVLIPHPHIGPPPIVYKTQPRMYPVMIPVPLCPAPVPIRRSMTPINDQMTLESKIRRKGSDGSLSSSKGTKSSRSTNRRRKNDRKINEITDEEIGKTYTGLDRAVAEEFITVSMDKY